MHPESRQNRPLRTAAADLDPSKIRAVGYIDGAFFVTERDWRSFGDVLRDDNDLLTWIGSPGWFAYEECRRIYDYLAARIDMVYWYPGEWQPVDFSESL